MSKANLKSVQTSTEFSKFEKYAITDQARKCVRPGNVRISHDDLRAPTSR